MEVAWTIPSYIEYAQTFMKLMKAHVIVNHHSRFTCTCIVCDSEVHVHCDYRNIREVGVNFHILPIHHDEFHLCKEYVLQTFIMTVVWRNDFTGLSQRVFLQHNVRSFSEFATI